MSLVNLAAMVHRQRVHKVVCQARECGGRIVARSATLAGYAMLRDHHYATEHGRPPTTKATR
jgi:hypothetical protein